MKTQTTLAAAVFAIVAALAMQASAAGRPAPDVAAQQAEQKAQQKDGKNEQAENCPCLEEKTGAAAHGHELHANQSAAAKVNPMFDRSKHFHPRDGGKL